MDLDSLLKLLKAEKIETWFDLGLFLDRFKEEQAYPPFTLNSVFEEYKEGLRKGGVAFMTYHYMVDGVTMEVEKYASLFRRNIPGIPIHYIAGEIHEKTAPLIAPDYKRLALPSLAGFDEWELYNDLYFTRLERGSEKYNSLITRLWSQCLQIIEELGGYIEREEINLFYIINLASNPGNVAYTLAVVLLSEFLKIPVISNNHDFYWEGGMSAAERERKGEKPGPRDFFFTNSHLGEVFSVIETLFPWRSRSWLQVNINRAQTDHLVQVNGHNPAGVMEVGTAVDTQVYTRNDKRRNISTFMQVESILSRYKDRLISYSVDDLLKGGLVSEDSARPILVGARTAPVDRFIRENIILLQPTRILSRKRIETSFNLLLKLYKEEGMIQRFKKTSHLKMTLLITGPIANGHHAYFRKLVTRFGELLEEAAPELKNRIYLALLFGELDRDSFKAHHEEAAGIPELYNIASLIVLPSKTEGRGLPIIEATACGTPIFCRRYEPENVYSEVIGEHLREEDRLKVLEFKGKQISDQMVKTIQNRLFFPHKYTDESMHNRQVVEKRYSLESLNSNMEEILKRLHEQLRKDDKVKRKVQESLDDYRDMLNFSNPDLETLLPTSHRHYLPGFGRLGYMLMLKSLIDPSSFRSEQQLVRGEAFDFARTIIQKRPELQQFTERDKLRFYNAVDYIFELQEGKHEIQHDHSMSYRHRNRNRYPYQDLTFQELTGWINLLYLQFVQPHPVNRIDVSPQFFTDWNLALLQLTGSPELAIDERKRLIRHLRQNRAVAYFPGPYLVHEMEIFALQSLRYRLGLQLHEAITKGLLEKKAGRLKPFYIFAQEKNLGKQLNKDEITDYIINGGSAELRLLHEFGVLQVVRTKQVCVGIHFPQMGRKALHVLRKIKDDGGYLLTNRRNASMMTDLVDMDRFHVGQASNEQTAHIMGIRPGSGYIQFVPAGLRQSLAYPTPVQTAKDMERALKSEPFKRLLEKLGEDELMRHMHEDALEKGTPLKDLFEKLENKGKGEEPVSYNYVSGLHRDGQPYNGVVARIDMSSGSWDFEAVSSSRPRTVLQICKDFKRKTNKEALLAWNGGYILNAELVGKLGIPEAFIGSPLGMIISGGKTRSAPLFNKPALVIRRDGSIGIERVNCRKGLKLSHSGGKIDFPAAAYNNAEGSGLAYFDLLFEEAKIPAKGRSIIRLSGSEVKQITAAGSEEYVDLLPVGITLALPPEEVPQGLKEGDTLDMQIHGYEDLLHAVEAGPQLLSGGRVSIDMEKEGWKHPNSIRTQAARLDYTDMRGPKIAVGTNKEGELVVLAINGRIRESVGATHEDMALILKKEGMDRAMGFDPGGSSTLVVDGRTLNISPYNKAYEEDPWSLAPEPRAVSNAILGFLK